MKRTAYITWLMKNTMPQVALVAVRTGTINNAWEKAIALQLMQDCANQNPQAFDVLNHTGDENYNKDTFMKAAKNDHCIKYKSLTKQKI
jgi:hypothetical protein